MAKPLELTVSLRSGAGVPYFYTKKTGQGSEERQVLQKSRLEQACSADFQNNSDLSALESLPASLGVPCQPAWKTD